MRLTPAIAVTNESTVLSDDEVRRAIPALQHQITYDFRPFWLVGARLIFQPKVPAGQPAADVLPEGVWHLAILDDSDQAGALGYHDVTPDGQPLMKVFAKTDQQYGLSWTITTSHELLEALADPWISSGWQVSPTEWYSIEVGDPVEADEFGYEIGGVRVSDFVLPAWYVRALSVPKYDFAGHVSQPLTVLEGGYVSIFVSGRGWTTKQMRDGSLADVSPDDPHFKLRTPLSAERMARRREQGGLRLG